MQWRRRIAARGLVTALLLAAPVAVAAEIGFSGGIGGLAGGLSTLASGPDTEPASERLRPSTPDRVAVVLSEATGGEPAARVPGGTPETGESEPGGGGAPLPGDTGPGGAPGTEEDPGDTGGDPISGVPEPEPPAGGDPVGGSDPVGSLLEGVGDTLDNTLNSLLGGGS